MSDAEFAGIGIIAGVAAMALIFLSLFHHPEQKEPIMEKVEVLVDDAQDGCLKGLLAVGVLLFIFFLLFNF